MRAKSFNLSLYYKVGDFLKYDPRHGSYGEIFTKIANQPFSIYVLYLEVFFRFYFNKLKDVTETITENYLSEKKVSRCALPRERRSASLSLCRLNCFHGKKIIKFLNVHMDPDIINYIFCTYL